MENEDVIKQDNNNDGIDRAGFLKCMAWAGTGVLWTMSGGIMKSFGMSQLIDKSTGMLKKGLAIPKSDFSFVQISDSHIGFTKPANPDVVGTLQAAIGKINAMPISIKPVEKAPIKKYFRDASLLFKLRLSLPVSMYNGIDMISIPRKSINNVLNEDEIETPHNTKNIKLKYSET